MTIQDGSENCPQSANSDESEFDRNHEFPFAGNFTKGMPHDADGGVDPAAYESFVRAMEQSDPEEFENGIVLAGIDGQRRMANPQGAYATSLLGLQPFGTSMPPAPSVSSDVTAAEAIELYWMANLRDVFHKFFVDGSDDSLVNAAARELTQHAEKLNLPTVDGEVTPATLFRAGLEGETDGPFISQFWFRDADYGSLRMSLRSVTTKPESDFMTRFDDWLEVQLGKDTADRTDGVRDVATSMNGEPPYVRRGRDAALFVRADMLAQSYLNAGRTLLGQTSSSSASIASPSKTFNTISSDGRKTSFDRGNPYDGGQRSGGASECPAGRTSATQEGFVTFGPEHFHTLVNEVVRRALQAARVQKFVVHRRLRPEEYGGLVYRILKKRNLDPACLEGTARGSDVRKDFADKVRKAVDAGKLDDTPVHADFFSSEALRRTILDFGTVLLPQAFPEGSPMHPSYGAGHATVAAACGTLTKAFFDEEFEITDIDFPFAISGDLSDDPKDDPKLVESDEKGDLHETGLFATSVPTVGSEINKLIGNHAFSRSMAGVHWRSDNIESFFVGEAIALALLAEQTTEFNEPHSFFVTTLDGVPRCISNGQIQPPYPNCFDDAERKPVST